jgi:hypothetical protein
MIHHRSSHCDLLRLRRQNVVNELSWCCNVRQCRQWRSGFVGRDGLLGLGAEGAEAYVTDGETFIMSARCDKAAEMLNQGMWSE